MQSTLIEYVLSSPHSRFVSDHGPAGCQALLQHRLIQANQKTQLSSGSAPEAARTYPLSLLEWTANRKKANMVLHVHCFDGESHSLKSISLFNCWQRINIVVHVSYGEYPVMK